MTTREQSTGSELLDAVSAFVKRFVSLSDHQVTAVSLWVMHTHCFAAAFTTPYLNISSAEKQCGKTRLLEVLKLVVPNPWLTGRATAAVLVRKIDAQRPTLLLDETDAAFASDREYAETLRGVLNSGHSSDGVTSLCIGQGANFQFKDFQVFCPKAIAGIGKLPDTVSDRSIPIRMKRRALHEHVERFRAVIVKKQSDELRAQLAEWSSRHLQLLTNARPGLPDVLSDRQQDGSEPLLAIANAAGGDWPQRARAALVALLTGEMAADDSVGILLLADIRTVFHESRVGKLSTADLIRALCDLNPQWLEFSHGKPISAASLGRRLKSYDIPHRKLRLDQGTFWGYLRESFEDAFNRYLARNLEHVEQCSNHAGEPQSPSLEPSVAVPIPTAEKSAPNPRLVPDVPVRPPDAQQTANASGCHIHGLKSEWWERPPRGSGVLVCARCHPQPFGVSASEIGFESGLTN